MTEKSGFRLAFERIVVEKQARLDLTNEERLQTAICWHLSGPWGRVPGSGELHQLKDPFGRVVGIIRK